MIISRTPFRVSYFGGGSDYPAFYQEHGGATILSAIDKYCYMSLHRLSPFFKHAFAAHYAQTEKVQAIDDFQHPLIRETLRFVNQTEGLEISHVADLPGRTGLGSSSSFTVGLLHALHAYRDQEVTPEDLSRQSIEIERHRIGDYGGYQDQYAAAYGGFIKLTFNRDGTVDVKKVQITAQRLQAFEERILMFYTGIEKDGNRIAQDQAARIPENTSVLKEMAAMVDEAERILIKENNDLHLFGTLLDEAWTKKKALAKGISNELIEDSYAAARKAGAGGGKLLGAGGRGFLLLFAEPDTHAAVREKLQHLAEVPFGLTPEGSEIIFRSKEHI